MSTKATIIIFAVVFAIGLFLVVALPFFWGQGPAWPRSPGGKKTQEFQDQGVFRSDDGGKTWRAKSRLEGQAGSISAFKVNELLSGPTGTATLYLATEGNGLWVSRSAGDLWAPVIDESKVLDPAANVLALAINPENGQEWYAAVFQKNRGRVLRSGDGGKTFREIYFTPLERYGVFDVHYDRTRRAISIVTGQGGLLATTDQGQSWRVVRWFRDGLIRLVVNPVNPAVRLAITPQGAIFRTADYGSTWADVSAGLDPFSGARSKQRWFSDRAGIFYLGSQYGLLRSYDGGMTFKALPLIIPPEVLPILAIAVSPQNSNRVMISAGSQIYETSDGGESWSILPSPGQKRVTHLVFDAQNSKTVYAVVQP